MSPGVRNVPTHRGSIGFMINLVNCASESGGNWMSDWAGSTLGVHGAVGPQPLLQMDQHTSITVIV